MPMPADDPNPTATSPAEQLREIDAELARPDHPAIVRQVLEEKRAALAVQIEAGNQAGSGSPTPANIRVDQRIGEVDGQVVGVNLGIVQAFYGARLPATPEELKELLDSYLGALIREHDRLRLGKLLSRERTGHDEAGAPAVSLRKVYMSLATSRLVPLDRFSLPRKVVLTVLESTDPQQVMPEEVRIAGPHIDAPNIFPEGAEGSIDSQGNQVMLEYWLERTRASVDEDSSSSIGGQWYRPELVSEVIVTQPHLVVLGSPGSGKSTALRDLALELAEALTNGLNRVKLLGWEDVTPLPVPLFCALGKVAKRLTDDPDLDFAALIDALLAPVENGRVREGLAPRLLQAWRSGGALICFDGLDEVSSKTEVTQQGEISRRERIATAIRRLADQVDRSRIVVTCRTRPYEENPAWQLGEGWAVREIQPFAFGQVRKYVPAWYAESCASDEARYLSDDAKSRAERLVDTLDRRPKLRELTKSPLLLTMLVLLDYNQKELPERQVDVYEELVMLLLDRWEGVRTECIHLAASKGAEKVGEIAGEKLADAGSSALIEIGRSAWDRIRGAVSSRGDEAAEAKAALTGFEAAPGSEAWQSMLATQLQSLAATDTELRKLLEELAGQVKPTAGGTTSTINMSGSAHADQVAGVKQGSMVYNASGAKQE